jgi:peptidoglycan hydrolase-like protein with peptidoglycan-binding domain
MRRGSTVILDGVDGGRPPGVGGVVLRELPLEAGAPTRPVLGYGASGAAVVDLQTRLGRLGLFTGIADGFFGPVTFSAVKAFQRSRGLLDDGIVGAKSWAALDAASPTRWGPPPAGVPPTLPIPSAGADPAIESLNLSEPARSGAYALKRKHPWVVFTSGRRDAARQASAMAGNVVKNRQWIAQTYAANPVSAAAQAWVDAHPEARTKEAIAAGLLGVFGTFSPRDLGRLSHHLSGLAFDVQPEPSQAAAFWSTVKSLPGLRQSFDTEGGLTIWHVGF